MNSDPLTSDEIEAAMVGTATNFVMTTAAIFLASGADGEAALKLLTELRPTSSERVLDHLNAVQLGIEYALRREDA